MSTELIVALVDLALAVPVCLYAGWVVGYWRGVDEENRRLIPLLRQVAK